MAFWTGAGAAVIGAGMNMIGGQQANAQGQDNMRAQMEWERIKMNSAHQAEVADLKAAGLNPILSANGGASGGSLSLPQVQNPLGNAASSAIDAMNLANEREKANSGIMLNSAQAAAATASAEQSSASAKSLGVNTQATESQLKAIAAKAKVHEKEAEYDQKFMKYDQYGKRVKEGLGMVNSAKDIINPGSLFKSVPIKNSTETTLPPPM